MLSHHVEGHVETKDLEKKTMPWQLLSVANLVPAVWIVTKMRGKQLIGFEKCRLGVCPVQLASGKWKVNFGI